jgi:hypothetical protein
VINNIRFKGVKMFKKLIALLGISLFLFSCTIPVTTGSSGNDSGTSGSVKFQLTNSASSSNAQKSGNVLDINLSQVDITNAKALIISVEDTSGNVVIDTKQILLYNFSGNFISEPVSLKAGNYKLTKYLVLDSSNTVIYATPVTGSPLAALVTQPLPISFSITKDTVTTLRPEIIDATTSKPQDFGYATFGFNVVNTFDFLVTVFIPTTDNFALTSANITVTSGTSTLYTGTLEAKTNSIKIKDVTGDYTVKVTKSGYNDYTATYTNAQMKAFWTSPLMVILSASQTAGKSFISVWKTDNVTTGSSNANQIKLPLESLG